MLIRKSRLVKDLNENLNQDFIRIEIHEIRKYKGSVKRLITMLNNLTFIKMGTDLE